jgi:ketosteroid isomerase-like protein
MTRADVDRWLERYVAAWKSYDRAAIGDLFADDVEYRYHPYDQPIRGREAVVASWLGESDAPGASTRDEPNTYDASYRTVAVEGDIAVAVGTSSYADEPGGPSARIFDNCYVIAFDDAGRCRSFTEWYMQRPRA